MVLEERRLSRCVGYFISTIYIEWLSHWCIYWQRLRGSLEKRERRETKREREKERERERERERETCLYSRARKSVMRSRRGADAENIHHARGTLSRPMDLRFIITFSPASRDRRPGYRRTISRDAFSYPSRVRSGVYAPSN